MFLLIRHVLTGAQFSAEQQVELFQTAEKLRRQDRSGLVSKVLKPKNVLLLFGEPSTRTRLSFEITLKKLGGDPFVIEEIEKRLSLVKDESWEDTIRTLTALGFEILVIRHRQNGLPLFLAQISDQYELGVSIINAGDGNNEHPTQALLDVYTVWRERREELESGRLTVAYLGDIKDSRVAHSGIPAFSAFSARVITPSSCLEAANQIDVWNFLRFQSERKDTVDMEESRRDYYERFSLTEEVRKRAKTNALFLHSRPRGPELPPEADSDPRQRYIINFKAADPWQNQETNGLYLRMALLTKMPSRKT